MQPGTLCKQYEKRIRMPNLGLYVRLEAKAGKEQEVESFLAKLPGLDERKVA